MHLADMSPLASAFVRGFMEASQGEGMLRKCGEAGVEAVEELGMGISSQYVSKLTRSLVQDGYILKVRKGRHYVVGKGDRYEEFFEWLENEAPEGWGLSNSSESEFPARLKAVNLDRLGRGVRTNAKEHRLEKGAFKLIFGWVNSGEMDQVFVRPDQRVVILEKKGKGWGVASEPQYWDEIDHEEVQKLISEMDGDEG